MSYPDEMGGLDWVGVANAHFKANEYAEASAAASIAIAAQLFALTSTLTDVSLDLSRIRDDLELKS